MSAIEPNYCPACGKPLAARRFDGRERAYCAGCDEYVFHLPSPSAGVAVVRCDEVLLVHRTGRLYGGTWAIPGGVIEWDESPRDAAARELAEETGVDAAPDALTLLDAFRLEGPRGEVSSINVNYVVPAAATGGTLSPGDEERDARFWTLDGIDASEESLRPGERERIRRALDGV